MLAANVSRSDDPCGLPAVVRSTSGARQGEKDDDSSRRCGPEKAYESINHSDRPRHTFGMRSSRAPAGAVDEPRNGAEVWQHDGQVGADQTSDPARQFSPNHR